MLDLMSDKTVACTSCQKQVAIKRFKFHPPNKDFKNGYYETRCPYCGAIFDYEANYIKEIATKQ